MSKRIRIMYLVLGLGMGIVISSVIYSFYPVTKAIELTDDEIIKRARELGMITLKESLDVEENKDDNVPKNYDDNINQNNDVHEINNDYDQQTEQEMEDNTRVLGYDGEETSIKSNGKYDEDDKMIVKFVVKWKETLTDVANNLYKLGLIDDVESFKSYAVKKGYSKILRVGEYEIEPNSSYEDILKILTKKK